MERMRIAVIGGGAAGVFGAVHAAESAPSASVVVFEATGSPLAKVRISGGGRCNVTNTCFDPSELVANYPRGGRELLGPLHRFGTRDVVEWFGARGVRLKAEPDGRMFPVTDESATVVNCLLEAAQEAGVRIETRCAVREVVRVPQGGFRLMLSRGGPFEADRVLLASGGGRSAGGARLAESLGHTVEEQVPSLFTFTIRDPRIADLAGVAVADATVRVAGTKLVERGPVLITHWGISGPGVLRLSAWGAREMHQRHHRFDIEVNWAGIMDGNVTREELLSRRATDPRKRVSSRSLFGIPGRLWERLIEAAGIDRELVWASLSNPRLEELVRQVTRCSLAVTGKSMNKDEFVTCGGVRLREVDFRTMESRVCPGLYLAGEILDIDGVTGGFNFQSAWTTGWIAGSAMGAGGQK